MVLRHDTSFLQVHVGEHGPLAGDQAPGEQVGQAFFEDLVPAEPGGGDVRRAGHGDLRVQVGLIRPLHSLSVNPSLDTPSPRRAARLSWCYCGGAVTVVVAIQGEAGSFSHAAALEALGQEGRLVPCRGFTELFRAVEAGEAGRGVVPIENSLAGSVHEAYDALGAHALHVVGETQVRVRHCLIVRPGTTMAQIRRVASHPVALAQCRTFFASHPGLTPVPAYDTAGSVRDLMAGGGGRGGSGDRAIPGGGVVRARGPGGGARRPPRELHQVSVRGSATPPPPPPP